MDTAIYIIASDDRETNQYRIALLAEKAKLQGSQYKIFSEINDRKNNQPLKKDLLARVYRNEFDTILVYKLCDLSSSPEQLAAELNDLDRHNIRVISYCENFDSFSLTGKLYMQVLITVNNFEPSLGRGTKGTEIDKPKSFNQHLPMPHKSERTITNEVPVCLNHIRGKIPSDETISPGNELNPGMMMRSGKNSDRTDSFDLIDMNSACELTGYSKNTLYQLTSRKLIPHFKRPRGRRLFFSRKSLELWILTGEI